MDGAVMGTTTFEFGTDLKVIRDVRQRNKSSFTTLPFLSISTSVSPLLSMKAAKLALLSFISSTMVSTSLTLVEEKLATLQPKSVSIGTTMDITKSDGETMHNFGGLFLWLQHLLHSIWNVHNSS